jgi:hypothetical protein
MSDPLPRPVAQRGDSARVTAARAAQWGEANATLLRQGKANYGCVVDRYEAGVDAAECTRAVTP